MDNSSPSFMTCDQLRAEFDKCPDDIDKRVLIIDVRPKHLFDRSHLCLDNRHMINSISTKMRVINIDPDSLRFCTAKAMLENLRDETDIRVFKRRKDATEVVVIDNHTDDMSELISPKSKFIRLKNGLTKFDAYAEDKIVVPIQFLKGGYREWCLKYPHFTTNPSFNPDAIDDDDFDMQDENTHPVLINGNKRPSPEADYGLSVVSQPSAPLRPAPTTPAIMNVDPPLPQSSHVSVQAHHIPPRPNPITKPVPITTKNAIQPGQPKMTVVKNAPGTAVPVTPSLSVRSALPRSHSSPNVAQPEDGDELDESMGQFGINQLSIEPQRPNLNNNHIGNHMMAASSVPNKPKFDRALKPSLNNENVNAIRAKLNFGRSPEASDRESITGLQNLGNTCFMNSVIQCLSYERHLVSYFRSDMYKDINFNSQDGSDGELAIEFGALVEKLNLKRYRYIEPKSFREAVRKHLGKWGFAGNQQQDSHEFMMMLLDKLHHDLNRKNKSKQPNGIVPVAQTNGNSNNNDENNLKQFYRKHLDNNESIISDLFEGIFMSSLTCTHCKCQSNTFEVFNCLSLPIPSESRCHVLDCLGHFSNPERIDAAWECPRCKEKREADKKIVICKLPRILIIHLKRFWQNGMWRQKLQTSVDFPLFNLNVDCTSVLPQGLKGTYNLSAVVNHHGQGMDGGHYTAFCKLPENNKWYKFNDSNVEEMKDTDWCGQKAYILFYEAT